jgi:hypothetical protein
MQAVPEMHHINSGIYWIAMLLFVWYNPKLANFSDEDVKFKFIPVTDIQFVNTCILFVHMHVSLITAKQSFSAMFSLIFISQFCTMV